MEEFSKKYFKKGFQEFKDKSNKIQGNQIFMKYSKESQDLDSLSNDDQEEDYYTTTTRRE